MGETANMTRKSVIMTLLVLSCACHGGDKPTPWPRSQDAALNATLCVSTNDLLHILLNATNSPFAASAMSVYRKHTVFLDPQGSLTARFDVVGLFSTEYELMSKLAECLVGSQVKVRRQPDGSYLYINERKDRFTIHVIHDECDTGHFQGVYYFTGDRRFYTLEVLLHLESKPNRDGSIRYGAHIYADSDSRFVNFLSKIPFVRHYLIYEVNDVVAKFDIVYGQMLRDPRANLRKVMQCRDPKGMLYFSDQDIEMTTKFVDKLLAADSAAEVP